MLFCTSLTRVWLHYYCSYHSNPSRGHHTTSGVEGHDLPNPSKATIWSYFVRLLFELPRTSVLASLLANT